MTMKQSDVLMPQLVRAEQSLKRALDEVCHADVNAANTGELIPLAEILPIANEAQTEAVSVRRTLRQDAPAEYVERRDDGGLGAQREFDDTRGVRWMVFAVYPSSTRVARSGLRPQFQGGWLAFDSGVETRRLAPIPVDWLELSNEALDEACQRAEVAPTRHPRAG